MQKRIPVAKTYKLYINGQFPRSESGRSFTVQDASGNHIAHMCLGSRKDCRDAVTAARKASKSWAARPAFNRGQILYRIAEMLEGRKAQFMEEMQWMGVTDALAEKEIACSIDRLVYYAGWCDKYSSVFGTINPVATPHFNFSVPEPMGVVAAFAPESSALAGLVSVIAPVIGGGNTCIVIASFEKPMCAVTLGEVLQVSDLPPGVVNIITGTRDELAPTLSEHMDVNAVVLAEKKDTLKKMIQHNAAVNIKRVITYEDDRWLEEVTQSPYRIMDLQEVKTTWHPIETYGGSGSSY